ncbi:unnamed protein product, partial [Rotaria sp. Silwood2]
MNSLTKTSNSNLNEVDASQTNEQHIFIIQEFLKNFCLYEIVFVVHLNSIYSKYDAERVERIASQLKLTFGTDHNINHVRTLLDFFSSQTRQLQACGYINIDQHLLTDAAAHHMEPFIVIYPTCSQYLSTKECNRTMVYICHQGGKVLPVLYMIFQGIAYSLTCKHKSSNNRKNTKPLVIYPNFIEQGDTKRISTKSLYHGDFVYIGRRYTYKRALIEQYTADLITNADSWLKTVDSLNRQAFNSEQHQEYVIDRRTLACTMYIYNIVQLDLFVGTPYVDLLKSLDLFDDRAWNNYPRLLASFIYFWSRHKETIGLCNRDKCSEAIVVDGHQKCRRRVCKVKDIQVKTDLFDKMVVGCCRTP